MNCRCLSHNGFLTRAGYRAAQQTSLEGLAPRGVDCYVDSQVSVSALDEDEDLPWSNDRSLI